MTTATLLLTTAHADLSTAERNLGGLRANLPQGADAIRAWAGQVREAEIVVEGYAAVVALAVEQAARTERALVEAVTGRWHVAHAEALHQAAAVEAEERATIESATRQLAEVQAAAAQRIAAARQPVARLRLAAAALRPAIVELPDGRRARERHREHVSLALTRRRAGRHLCVDAGRLSSSGQARRT
jgi:hypothetical protein